MSLRKLPGELAWGVLRLAKPYLEQVRRVAEEAGPDGAMKWVKERPPADVSASVTKLIEEILRRYGFSSATNIIMPMPNTKDKIFALSNNIYSVHSGRYVVLNIFIVMPMERMDDASIDVFMEDHGEGKLYRYTIWPYSNVRFEEKVPIGKAKQYIHNYINSTIYPKHSGAEVEQRKNTRRKRRV
ncbi:MAG: hypothetical protein ACK4SY_07100 [Pyrobaculum sp.]